MAETIIRLDPGEDGPYYSLARSTAQDERLSWEAWGLLSYLHSLPRDWRLSPADLVKRRKGGEARMYRMIRELIDAGYITRQDSRTADGRIVCWEYFVRMRPHLSLPDVAEPDVANRGSTDKTVEDRTLDRTHITDGMRRLCELMADHAQEMTGERPTYGDRWLTACRLLVTRDGLGEDGVEAMIRWVMADGFWSPNILSMTKLREKRPQLVAKMRNGNGHTRGQSRAAAGLDYIRQQLDLEGSTNGPQ